MSNPYSITSYIQSKSEKFGNLPLLENQEGILWTYKDFGDYVSNSTKLLQPYLEKGNCKFCIAMPNTPEFLLILFGGISCGATAVNLNPGLSNDEFFFRLKDSQVSYLFILPDLAERLKSLTEALKIKCIIVGEQPAVNTIDSSIWLSSKDLMARGSSIQGNSVNNLAFLQYTGGTTGTTKAAMISHNNVLSSVELMGLYLKKRLEIGQEVFVVTFPFYHVFSIVFQVLMAMQFGAKIIIYPFVRDFNVLKSIIKKQNFTVFVGVHTLYKMMLNDEELVKLKFPKTKIFIAGAEHIQPLTKKRWKEYTGHNIIEGYGLTETSALVAMSSLDENENDFDAIGVPLPKTDLALLNDDGQIIDEFDTPGEICIKGPQVVEGYWNRTEENGLTFFNGWLRTGDIGLRKSNGQFKIVDRKKDMINVSGFNVYPNEVEAVLMDFPGIIDCAAVAIPDEKSGERVAVFFISTQNIDLVKLQLHCQNKMSAYKVPVKYIQIENIPKSPVGKTLRMELRKIISQK